MREDMRERERGEDAEKDYRLKADNIFASVLICPFCTFLGPSGPFSPSPVKSVVEVAASFLAPRLFIANTLGFNTLVGDFGPSVLQDE